MITLFTGSNGTGKTARIVYEIMQAQKGDNARLLYQHGIKDLKIDHTYICCKDDICELCKDHKAINSNPLFAENWKQFAPHGSLIVLDEVQRVFRPANSSQAPSQGLRQLEDHRSGGYDFWCITQSPSFVHAHIKKLTRRHVHFLATWKGRKQYEWPECRDEVTRRSDAVEHSYKLPKETFSLYKSAELHTEIKNTKPLSFYVFIGCLFFVTCMVAYLGNSFYNRLHPASIPTVSLADGQKTDKQTYTTLKKPLLPIDFTPRVPGVLESAPAYDEILKVQSAPLIAGCVASQDKCTCYTRQATIRVTSDKFCHDYVKKGEFNPYKPDYITNDTAETAPQGAGAAVHYKL